MGYLRQRIEDYNLSLVGELFDRLRNPYEARADWARLGNAMIQAEMGIHNTGSIDSANNVSNIETAIYAATAFYCGGYSASAYLTLKAVQNSGLSDAYKACFDLLARPRVIVSDVVRSLVAAVQRGDLYFIDDYVRGAVATAQSQMDSGPDEWIQTHLLAKLCEQFARTNVRKVLPDGGDEFWSPLVRSFLSRTPPIWDFFPSQIEAFERGLLQGTETYSLQMPTGAGKTALTETVLYHHAKNHPAEAAILLVVHHY